MVMTVAELVELLEDFDPDLPVFFESDGEFLPVNDAQVGIDLPEQGWVETDEGDDDELIVRIS